MNEVQSTLPAMIEQLMTSLESSGTEGNTFFSDMLEKIQQTLNPDEMNALMQQGKQALSALQLPIPEDISADFFQNMDVDQTLLTQWLSDPDHAALLDQLKSLKNKKMEDIDLSQLDLAVPLVTNLQNLQQSMPQKVKDMVKQPEVIAIADCSDGLGKSLSAQVSAITTALHPIKEAPKDIDFKQAAVIQNTPKEFEKIIPEKLQEKFSNHLLVEQTANPIQLENQPVTTYKFIKEFDFEKNYFSDKKLQNQLQPLIMSQDKPAAFNLVANKEAMSLPNHTTAQETMTRPITDQQWSTEVADKLQWFSNHNIKSAKLMLNPRELGNIEAHINIVENKAQITLLSQHATVREALEQSMPQLKELFANNDVSLSKVIIAEPQPTASSQHQAGTEQKQFSHHEQSQEKHLPIHEKQDVLSNRRQHVISAAKGQIDYYA